MHPSTYDDGNIDISKVDIAAQTQNLRREPTETSLPKGYIVLHNVTGGMAVVKASDISVFFNDKVKDNPQSFVSILPESGKWQLRVKESLSDVVAKIAEALEDETYAE